jgi:hypothetical protein
MIAVGVFDLLLAILFIAGAMGLAFGPYFLTRKLFLRRNTEKTYDLAGSVLFRIGALHALILALMFAHVTSLFLELRNAVTDEAAATADVYHDLERYENSEITETIRRDLALYAGAVINDEWPLLANRQLSSDAWEQWRKVFDAILDFEPESPRQEDLRGFMLQNMADIARFRERRQIGAKGNVPSMFWVVAIAGFALISLPYFVFEPSPANMMLLCIFAAYNGLVLYVIYATGHPFDSPVAVDPAPFKVVFGNV